MSETPKVYWLDLKPENKIKYLRAQHTYYAVVNNEWHVVCWQGHEAKNAQRFLDKRAGVC
jgi:hypothetical protein